MNKISIIIPVLNEESNIMSLLEELQSRSHSKNLSEIIVVDGGSTDQTLELLSERPDIKLLHSEAGRAKQMNAGAKVARGEILYFLHADSIPPPEFDQLILNRIANGHRAGCFRLEFDDNHWWLKLAGWFTQFNWRICRGGDQSLFIDKALFEELDGFNEKYMIYEDNELIQRLYDNNGFTVINRRIKTSARCYRKNGIWRLQYHFWAIYFKKRTGASAEELYSYYKRNIA